MRTLMPLLLLMYLAIATAAAGTPLPSLPVRILAGEPMQLPAALPDRPVLLIVGFTRASRTQIATWARCLPRDGSDRQEVAIFRAVVIEDVPRPFRNAAIRDTQNSVPVAMRARFLLEREIAWRHQGAANEVACQGLQAAINAQSTR